MPRQKPYIIITYFEPSIGCRRTSCVRRNDGGKSFQKLTREPLGCYSKRTSSMTYSNACLYLGTKSSFVTNKRPASITLLSWSSYTKSLTRNLDFSPYMFGLCRRTFSEKSFQRKWGPQNHRNSISGIVFPYKLIYLLCIQQFHTHFTQIDDRSSENIHA